MVAKGSARGFGGEGGWGVTPGWEAPVETLSALGPALHLINGKRVLSTCSPPPALQGMCVLELPFLMGVGIPGGVLFVRGGARRLGVSSRAGLRGVTAEGPSHHPPT